jgi:predicted Zn-dependent protease with MMP-like domain
VTASERRRFDALLERVLDALPPRLHELLEEAPLIVEDRPSRKLMKELDIDEEDELLCGLHSGTPLTERSVEHSDMPETIHIFREGILEQAGGWTPRRDEEGNWIGGVDALTREIRVTILHEIGHHFGLEEDDLAELGYE